MQKYKAVNNFFSCPIPSSKVGTFLVDELNESYTLIEFNGVIKKCALFLYKSISVTISACLEYTANDMDMKI